MAIKDIVVHIDNSKACASRLEAAIALAQAHDAHVTGVYVVYVPAIPTYAEVHIPEAIMAQQREQAMEMAAEAEKLFEDATTRQGLRTEWRAVEDDYVNALSVHGRYSDLVVTGQPDARDPLSMSHTLPDHVVLTTGRPVLVIPYIGFRGPIGERVVVAWNASREAVRAVNDALPILTRAKHVEVLSINAPKGARGEGDVPSADIGLHLARHGVKAQASSVEAKDIDAGDVLLSRAADLGADLIVMGAYGHSRFRELVLGGVTRHLLEHMTVPVLMSH